MQNEITVNEAVKRTAYSRQMIYNLVREGKVRSQKRGWQYWLDWRSLAAYCAQHGRELAKPE